MTMRRRTPEDRFRSAWKLYPRIKQVMGDRVAGPKSARSQFQESMKPDSDELEDLMRQSKTEVAFLIHSVALMGQFGIPPELIAKGNPTPAEISDYKQGLKVLEITSLRPD